VDFWRKRPLRPHLSQISLKLFLLIILESIHCTKKIVNFNRYYQKTVVKSIFYVVGCYKCKNE